MPTPLIVGRRTAVAYPVCDRDSGRTLAVAATAADAADLARTLVARGWPVAIWRRTTWRTSGTAAVPPVQCIDVRVGCSTDAGTLVLDRARVERREPSQARWTAYGPEAA